MSYTILIVEDDIYINQLLVKMLNEAGYQTIEAFSGTEASLLLEKEVPDLILLDLMLPGKSGEELLQEIRQHGNSIIPILVLSAKNSLGDKLNLLRSGADDYVTKPFDPEEVVARVETLLRRIGKMEHSTKKLVYKKIQLYPESRNVAVDEKELTLTAYEYDILYLLLQHPKKVYSREIMYELVWKGGYYGENNTVNVHVSNLRKKIKELDATNEYIQTVYGIGFKLQ